MVLASLIFMIALVSSGFASVFSGVSLFVLGAPDIVSNETELRNAVDTATGSTVIALGKDIALTESTLTIPANKNITLTSSLASGFYKLIGADGKSTFIVEGGGMLRLDGIIVTHESGKAGSGVTVDSDGTLILYSGEISGIVD
jgi:hypothetical protein